MSNLSPQAQAVITAFQQSGVTADQAANLQAVIAGSPALTAQINQAVAHGHLKTIVPLQLGTHAGGEYHAADQSMHLPLSILTTPPPAQGPFKPGEATFVLGHELQHGFNRLATAQANTVFHGEAQQTANSHTAVHDYTSAIGNLIAANRRDEAAAQITGWNAVVSQIKTLNPNPTLKDIYRVNAGRMADFIDMSAGTPPAYTLKSNLTLNADLSLSPTPANLEAMGQNYFDKAPIATGLGDLGKSDYTTYYGVFAMEQCIGYERQHHTDGLHKMTVNMTALKLNEKLLEEEGIDLGNINQASQPYYDSSQTPAVLHHFDHTQTGAHNHQYVPIAPAPETLSLARERGFDAFGHPDHALYAELKQHLPPETSGDRLAQITLGAKMGGLQSGRLRSIDIRDDAVFVTGTTPGMHGKIDLTSPPPSMQDTLQRSGVFDQQQQQHLQFHYQQRHIEERAQHGPRMSMG